MNRLAGAARGLAKALALNDAGLVAAVTHLVGVVLAELTAGRGARMLSMVKREEAADDGDVVCFSSRLLL